MQAHHGVASLMFAEVRGLIVRVPFTTDELLNPVRGSLEGTAQARKTTQDPSRTVNISDEIYCLAYRTRNHP